MWLVTLVAAFSTIIAWALCRAVRQFRYYESIEPDRSRNVRPLPRIALIVPVRNEAANVVGCLKGLLGQDYPPNLLELIVVDDGSTDGTANIVQRLAHDTRRIRSIKAGDLPVGWMGKPHACWRGATAVDAEWLCFIDADTRANEALMRSAIRFAYGRRLDMLSLEPFQELTGFLDRLVFPLGFLAIAATQDLRRVNRPDTAAATANGQFILVRATSYFSVGGHSAVRGAICEDSALACRVKDGGMALAVVGAESLIRTRMYANVAALWEGLSKNATQMYGGEGRTLAIAAAGFTIGWGSLLLPIFSSIAVATEQTPVRIATLVLAALGSCAAYATQIALAHRFRIPFWYGLLFPLSCSVGALIAANAVINRGRGRVIWKGRVYAGRREGRRVLGHQFGPTRHIVSTGNGRPSAAISPTPRSEPVSSPGMPS